LQGENRAKQNGREKVSKFRETLDIKDVKGNPEPSPRREGAETRHSLPKSEKDRVKV
jgi:hypothetical protein